MLVSLILLWKFLTAFIPNLFSSLLIFSIDLRDRIRRRIENIQSSSLESIASSSSTSFNQNQIEPNSSQNGSVLKLKLSLWYLIKWIVEGYAKFISILIELYAQLMHSYEMIGIENIPKKGPALMIGYHGPLPTDLIFATSRMFRELDRYPRAVADRFLFTFGNISKEYLFSGPASRCIEVLRDGHLLMIAPGGTREAQFATDDYEILWNNRCGYARVAKAANAPIIPIFTKNVRELYFMPKFLQQLLRPLYERIRFPVVPLFGAFPIKLITYIGQPIPADAAETPEQLAQLAQKAMNDLIVNHQKFPATIMDAFKERLIKCDKLD